MDLFATGNRFVKKRPSRTLKQQVEAVPTLKGHESEPQAVSETVPDVFVVLVMSEKAAQGVNYTFEFISI